METNNFLTEYDEGRISHWKECAFYDDKPYAGEAPERVYTEATQNYVKLNVMPERYVEETLFIKEYRIWDGYAEGIFDRKYISQMEKSPDHMIFVSALVHLQKMLYVYVVHNLGLDYDPNAAEQVKFWPTEFKFNLTGLVRQKTDLVQKIMVDEIVQKPSMGGFEISGHSRIGKGIELFGRCPFFIVGNK